MRILEVTPYAPYRDGIAAYAVQEVAELRRAGHHVEVLSPAPSAAHHHLPLPSTRSMVELIRRARGFDRVVVQFHPDVFFHPSWPRWQHLVVWALFVVLGRVTDLEFRLHEIDYRHTPRDASPMRLAMHGASRISVHTSAERELCRQAFGLGETAVEVIDHGGAFVAHTALDREEARHELGLDPDGHIFVSIGFIQPHKGFDRAVRAFARLEGVARLYVVGDTRTDDEAWVEYLGMLADLCDRTPGVELRRGFVSDEHFDLWIRAADHVVLPYRMIWSSSVVERAHLLGTPAIVTAVGGLSEQIHAPSVAVEDDDALARTMAAAAGTGVRSGTSSGGGDLPSRDELLARVRAVHPPRRARAAAVSAVAALGPTPRAEAVSANPVYRRIKRTARRLVIWMIEPIAIHLDRALAAVRDDLDAVDERLRSLESRSETELRE